MHVIKTGTALVGSFGFPCEFTGKLHDVFHSIASYIDNLLYFHNAIPMCNMSNIVNGE